MVRPVVNLDELDYDDVEENGVYTSSRAAIGARIGARDLGYNLTVLPPGKVQCPFHCHHGEEEMFFILEGEGELRFGDRRYPIRAHDVIVCPTGGAEVAHQIVNTGAVPMRYLAVSTLVPVEACEYPDSGKVLIVTGDRGARRLCKMFRAETDVDYYDREKAAKAAPDRTNRPRRLGWPSVSEALQMEPTRAPAKAGARAMAVPLWPRLRMSTDPI